MKATLNQSFEFCLFFKQDQQHIERINFVKNNHRSNQLSTFLIDKFFQLTIVNINRCAIDKTFYNISSVIKK